MLLNVLNRHNIQRNIVTLVTMVEVSKDDKAFTDPVKRVGKIYTREQADDLARTKGWKFGKEQRVKDGWRRVVPSPLPVKILNENVIQATAMSGTIVIAAGGGGIPVYYDENGDVRPAEAVIDKDLAGSLLAARIKADEFYILTDVPYVFINYNQPDQQPVEFLNYADTVKYLEQGMFGEGSMAPKIRACLQFIEKGGSKSVITDAFKLSDKKFGTKITMEYED